MRTWVLSKLFKWNGTPVHTINKGRAEKKALTQKENKELNQLPHTTERYLQVFKNAGVQTILDCNKAIRPATTPKFDLDKTKQWIGLAPFSKHIQKEWPLTKVDSLLRKLSESNKYEVLLFGGGEREKQLLEKIASKYTHVQSVVGKFNLTDEISLVKKLSLLVSMDSFNMHLASLLGVKVVSIWGATHSLAGFGPVNGNEAYKVEIPINELTCRPCSVFGSKPCHKTDLACMNKISEEMVLEKVNFALQENN